LEVSLINKNNNTSKTKDHHQDKVQDHSLLRLSQVKIKIRLVTNHHPHHKAKLNQKTKSKRKTINLKLETKKNSKDQVEKKNINLASHSTKTHKKCNQWSMELLEEYQAMARTKHSTLDQLKVEAKLRKHNHHLAICLVNNKQVQV